MYLQYQTSSSNTVFVQFLLCQGPVPAWHIYSSMVALLYMPALGLQLPGWIMQHLLTLPDAIVILVPLF